MERPKVEEEEKKKKNTFPDSGVCVVTREVREGKRVKIKKH